MAARIAPGTPVLAGPGNNGGDALVAATVLRAMGHDVRVLLPAGPQKLPPDATRAYDGWVAAGGGRCPRWNRVSCPGWSSTACSASA